MIEIVAPPPADWPERITVTRTRGMLLIDRDGLVGGSLAVTDWPAAAAGIIIALGVLGYAVAQESDGVMVFARHGPSGWDTAPTAGEPAPGYEVDPSPAGS